MKRKSSLSVVLPVLVWAVAASTTSALQVPVDFSGRWVLESEPLPSEPTELVVRQTSGPGSIPREGVARQLPLIDVVEGTSSGSPTAMRRMIQPPFVESSSCRADRIGPQTVRDALGPRAQRIVVHAYDKQVWPTMTDVAAYVHRIVDGVPENGRLDRTPAFSEAVILTITASAELGDGGRRPIEFANGYVHVMGEDGCEWWGRYRGPYRSK